MPFQKSILTFRKFCYNSAIVVESFYHASFWIQSTKTVNNRVGEVRGEQLSQSRPQLVSPSELRAGSER